MGLTLFCHSEEDSTGLTPAMEIDPPPELPRIRKPRAFTEWSYRSGRVPYGFPNTSDRRTPGILTVTAGIRTVWPRYKGLLSELHPQPILLVENLCLRTRGILV